MLTKIALICQFPCASCSNCNSNKHHENLQIFQFSCAGEKKFWEVENPQIPTGVKSGNARQSMSTAIMAKVENIKEQEKKIKSMKEENWRCEGRVTMMGQYTERK